jgi:hypothetical protein
MENDYQEFLDGEPRFPPAGQRSRLEELLYNEYLAEIENRDENEERQVSVLALADAEIITEEE